MGLSDPVDPMYVQGWGRPSRDTGYGQGDPSDPVKRGGPKRGSGRSARYIGSRGFHLDSVKTGAKKVRQRYYIGCGQGCPLDPGETGVKGGGVWQKREKD